MDLKEWAIAYVKNKDLTQRKLVKIEDKKDHLECVYKDKTIITFVLDKLDEKIFDLMKDKEHKMFAAYNKEENFKFLIKHWEKLSKIKNLSFVFVNDKFNDKWQINPYLHSLIADPDSIENGLKTMYDTANGKAEDIKPSKKKTPMFESNHEDEEGEEEN
jgi:hypothetical protein